MGVILEHRDRMLSQLEQPAVQPECHVHSDGMIARALQAGSSDPAFGEQSHPTPAHSSRRSCIVGLSG